MRSALLSSEHLALITGLGFILFCWVPLAALGFERVKWVNEVVIIANVILSYILFECGVALFFISAFRRTLIHHEMRALIHLKIFCVIVFFIQGIILFPCFCVLAYVFITTFTGIHMRVYI